MGNDPSFWHRGEKVRFAYIYASEVNHPPCRSEATLGARATSRRLTLLNRGLFRLEPIDRDRDRYGSLLRTVTRGGASVGEGQAEQWKGNRGTRCLGRGSAA